MMGAGGAMMMWRLAWLRAFPDESRELPTPYIPSIAPLPRDRATPLNQASWNYRLMLEEIEFRMEFRHDYGRRWTL